MNRLALTIFAVLIVASTPLLAQNPAPVAPANPAVVKPIAVTPPTAAIPAPAVAAPAPDPNALKWSAETLDYNPKPGEASAPFTFYVTNVSATSVSITSLRTSCGCTVAQLPPLPAEPFKLGAGSNAPINVTMDLRGKVGTVMKSINVDTSVGAKSLLVRVNMPAPEPAPVAAATPGQPAGMDRAKNIQNALADRQAVFKGDCASCHVEKGKGKMGAELYAASCGICHDAEHRAAMVPDLKIPRGLRDLSFWQKWIMEGKPGTMMPAFAQIHGGPLSQDQIDSLTVYLYQTYPKSPAALLTPQTPAPHAVAATPSTTPPLPPGVQKN